MNKRARAILKEVFSNLSEYYVVLGARSGNLIRKDLADRVNVPDTGNDQADYEATRDQVESVFKHRKAVQFTLEVEFDDRKTDPVHLRVALNALLGTRNEFISLKTANIGQLATYSTPFCPFGRGR